MTRRYLVVAGRIRHDLESIERVVTRAQRAMQLVTDDDDGRLLIDSAALNLHDFYAGLERLLESVASTVDQTVPAGPDWHRELLGQLSTEIPGIRPAVLTEDIAQALDEYLRFRHVVRNVYAFELDRARVEALVAALPAAFEQLRSALLEFADYLQDVGSDER